MTEGTDNKRIQDFITACGTYLDGVAIADLRAYGRNVGVSRATAKRKSEIIEDIIAIFCGDLEPIERSRRGAPVRADSFDPKIAETVNALRFAHLSHVEKALKLDTKNDDMDWGVALKETRKKPSFLEVEDVHQGDFVNGERKIRVGQLQTLNEVNFLLPLNCINTEEKVVISEEFIAKYNLQEGDIVSYYAQKSRAAYVATQILQINGYNAENFSRDMRFGDMEVCYPNQRICSYSSTQFNKIEHKFTQWLIPFGMGQRGLVISSPKAGKTQYLLSLVQAVKTLNPKLETYVLLVDQAPETVGAFRKTVGNDNVLYTTYEDEPDRQIFVANFLLKRAKCQVESGKDVILFIDSFNSLARAYNDTEESAGGKILSSGLESKTMHYIKKYLGAARKIQNGGSLSIVGSVTIGSGVPSDEAIAAELSLVANLEIRLSDDLAFKRIFPALDLSKIYCKNEDELRSPNETKLISRLREKYPSATDAEKILSLIKDAQSMEDLFKKACIQ